MKYATVTIPIILHTVFEKTGVPGKAASNRIGMEERADCVADANSDQFLVSVNLILITSGEGFGNGDTLQESNHSHDDEALTNIL